MKGAGLRSPRLQPASMVHWDTIVWSVQICLKSNSEAESKKRQESDMCLDDDLFSTHIRLDLQ